MDGIFPALLQEGWRILVPYMVKIFCACMVTGYIAAIWHQFKFLCSYLSQVGIPIVDLGILDLSVSH